MNETPETPSPEEQNPAQVLADGAEPQAVAHPAEEAPAAPETPATPDAPAAPAAPQAAARPVAPPAPVYTNGQHTPPAPVTPALAAPAAPSYPAPATAAAPAAPTFAAPTAPLASSIPPAAPHLEVPSQNNGSTKAEKGASFRRAPVGVIAALAIGALVGGVSGAGVAYFAVSNNGGSNTQAQSIPANITVNDPDNATTVTAVAASAGASVVTISAVGTDASGTGSGVVISKDGYILTNTHVVTLEGATADAKVSVQMSDGRLFDATIVGTDPIVDLAVIKIDGVTDLTPIEFADSSALNVGDTAIAIGAPLGLNNTVTNGIVSALNRSITIASSAVPEGTEGEEAPDQSDGSNPFEFWQFDTGEDSTQSNASSTISVSVIQTDAAINPGNSGGALLDSSGKLIGINVAIASAGGNSAASGNIGVGFAVPGNLAKRVAEEIIANGSATHGLLGASVLDVTEDADIADSAVVGASIKEVVDGGAAAAAGLKVGDVITGIDGLPITGKSDLTAQVRALAAGAKATVTYVRNGKTQSTDVTLGTL